MLAADVGKTVDVKQAEAGYTETAREEEAATVTAARHPWPVRAALQLIWYYQHYISSWTPPSCRFHPTCSHYTYQAIERFGFWRGFWLGLCRLGKCHPLHKGGFDPVPSRWPSDKHTNSGDAHSGE